MPRLILKDGNRYLGAISDADVKVLIDELEEEDMADDDYFIDTRHREHPRGRGRFERRSWSCCSAPSATPRASTFAGRSSGRP